MNLLERILIGLGIWTALAFIVGGFWYLLRHGEWLSFGPPVNPEIDRYRVIPEPPSARLKGLWGRYPGEVVTHLTPPFDGPQVTSCCGVPLAEIPPGDAISHEPERRTCNRFGDEGDMQ